MHLSWISCLCFSILYFCKFYTTNLTEIANLDSGWLKYSSTHISNYHVSPNNKCLWNLRSIFIEKNAIFALNW